MSMLGVSGPNGEGWGLIESIGDITHIRDIRDIRDITHHTHHTHQGHHTHQRHHIHRTHHTHLTQTQATHLAPSLDHVSIQNSAELRVQRGLNAIEAARSVKRKATPSRTQRAHRQMKKCLTQSTTTSLRNTSITNCCRKRL